MRVDTHNPKNDKKGQGDWCERGDVGTADRDSRGNFWEAVAGSKGSRRASIDRVPATTCFAGRRPLSLISTLPHSRYVPGTCVVIVVDEWWVVVVIKCVWENVFLLMLQLQSIKHVVDASDMQLSRINITDYVCLITRKNMK